VSNSQTSEPVIKPLQIVVNGDPKRVCEGLTVLTLLAELGVRGDRVAVERNRVIVRQAEWADTPIEAGDQFEIVQFVGGG
jgi:thiamine biosynthesis protein ThiS